MPFITLSHLFTLVPANLSVKSFQKTVLCATIIDFKAVPGVYSPSGVLRHPQDSWRQPMAKCQQKIRRKREYFATVFAWEPWNSDVIYKNGKLEESAALEAERVNYNSLCKLLLGWGWVGLSRERQGYNNLHLFLSSDCVPGLCDAVCVCHRWVSKP